MHLNMQCLIELSNLIRFYFMDDPLLVKHAPGAPGLRILGLGPKFFPQQGILKRAIKSGGGYFNEVWFKFRIVFIWELGGSR